MALKSISRAQLKKMAKDGAASAAALKLRYVCADEPGILRIRKGKQFLYEQESRKIEDETILQRISSLVIPPAWENVWVCKDENGHLQATGFDVAGRKQYRYHPQWAGFRNQTKFAQLEAFGKAIPTMRERLHQDLAKHGMPLEKVLAILVSIMQETGIRIGNAAYEKANGSFGLSTLKGRHVTVSGSTIQFKFRGKKGVFQDLSLQSKKLARLVKRCMEIPGKELFQYLDEEGNKHSLDSGSVNAYIKEISGGDFSAKDFRTWAGSVTALIAFQENGCQFESRAEAVRGINAALDIVSNHLGNTRTVCKKYYVFPGILALYECQKLDSLLKNTASKVAAENGLTPTENVLMKVLKTQC